MRRACVAAAAAWALAAGAGAQETKEKAPDAPSGWELKGFSLEKPAAGVRITLKGYVQADFRSFQDWSSLDSSGESTLPSDFEWRRSRLGLEGEWRRLSFDVNVDPAFDEGDELKDAWLDLRVSKAFQIRGGNMKVPMSSEFLTSPAKTDFVERAAFVDSIGPNRDWGGLVHGEISRAIEYQAGVFVGDNRTKDNSAGTTGAGRLVLKPTRWLDLGGSFSQGDVEAAAAGPGLDPEPKGLPGTSVSGYVFFPPVFVNGRRLRWGADARMESGPVSLWVEFLQTREERNGQGPTLLDLPELRGDGWSATATWLVTGDKKRRTIKPRQPSVPRAGSHRAGSSATSRCGSTTWRTRASSPPAAARATSGPPGTRRSRAASAGGLVPSCASWGTWWSRATRTPCALPRRGRRATT